MKKLYFLFFICLAIINVACSEGQDRDLVGDRPLSVSKLSFSFNENGGEDLFYVQSGTKYDITSANPEWCTFKADGERLKGLDQYRVNIAFNLTNKVRTSSISITDGRDTHQIMISQEAGNTIVADQTGMSHSAMEVLHSIRKGWNLYNTLEATGGETAWGQPKTTQAIIDNAVKLGYNGIRIPCSWNQYVVSGTTSDINPEWMARVKEVVDYCIKADAYAILNIHWDGGWLQNDIPNGYNKAVRDKQFSFWKQIATAFRDYDEHLIFASANEPNASTPEEWETLRKYHQACIDAVRSTGGRNFYRTIIVQAPNTNIDSAAKLMTELPRDYTPNRLGIEVHFYTPSTFCILEEDGAWGGAKCQWFWGDNQQKYATGDLAVRWRKDGNESFVRQEFKSMYDTFVSKGYPVLVGEYGMVRRKLNDKIAQEGHDISCKVFLKTVTSEAKAYGCTPCYWSGFFNRHTGEITDYTVYEGLEEGARTEYLSFDK